MSFTHVRQVVARLEPFEWRWADENRAAIGAHWKARRAGTPALFNGQVLMMGRLAFETDACEAWFFTTDYANLTAWIDQGQPDDSVANGFAMGALQTADGAFVLGRMAPHTANAGRFYFPCGTPDLSDVTADGEVDLAGSLVREITEETGFARDELMVEAGWTIVRDNGLVAFMRRVRLALDGDAARARILAHLSQEPRPELSEVGLVRSLDDIAGETRMPAVVPLYLADAFAAVQG